MRHGIQAELSEKTGISRGFLCDILKCRRRVSPLLARRLESATGIDKAIWVFEPELLRGLLEEKFPKKVA